MSVVALLLAALLAGCSQTPAKVPTSNPTPTPSSTGWTQKDIGTVGVKGYMTEQSDGKSLTVYGAGSDIWGSSDGFHYSYKTLSGDMSITTRVASVKKVNDWTKAGVMFRDSTAPDSQYVFVLLSAQNGTDMQVRSAAGATTTEPGWDHTPRPPFWVRLTRVGDTFTGYQSPDGKTWTKLGSATVKMPTKALVGLAVTSRSETQLANAVFDNTTVVAPETTPSPTPPPAPAPTPTKTQSVTYSVDSSIFPNPERGWYIEPNPGSYGSLYSSGYTLAMRYVRLDNYRNSALPTSFLDSLKQDFASVRGTGVKLVLRFAYNRSYAADAPINIVLQQLQQLSPILHEYSDVIAVMQAGFIGAYGEWHHSTNNLGTLANRTKITNAILAALPTTRMTEIRTPFRADDIYPTPPDAATAFDGSNASRVGQHNDCFLSDATDGGTFQSPSDYTYAKQVTLYTPMGGETCSLGGLWSRNDCPTSLQEMATYHWDYLNASYWSAIYDKWKQQGCYDEVTKRLGYRFSLDKVTSPTAVSPGASLDMAITMTNSGFGKLYNPRPLELVFVPDAGGNDVTVTVSSDVRRLVPGPGDTSTINVTAALPSGTPSGTYQVYLNLPDASSHLNTDPKYSIRLANQGTWVASSGYNNLNLKVTVN